MSAALDKSETYLRKSETESICMNCYSTVRSSRWDTLEEAEAVHSEVCRMRDSNVAIRSLQI